MTLSNSSENRRRRHRSKPVNQVTLSAQELWNEHQPDLFSLWKPTLALTRPADTEQAAAAAPFSCGWELLLSEVYSCWFQPGSEADTDQLYTCSSTGFSSSLHPVTSCPRFESSFAPVCFTLSLLHCCSLLSIIITHLPSTLLFLMFFPSFYRFPSSSACVHFDLSKMLTFEDAECSEGQAESERRAR